MPSGQSSSFLYASCQHGAEKAVKQLCQPIGPYRLAFSCKGFVTLKSELSIPIWSKALPESPWIRSRGHVLGKIENEDSNFLLDRLCEEFLTQDWEYLHILQRDVAMPGWNGFEPGASALAQWVTDQIRDRLMSKGDSRAGQVGHEAPTEAKVIEVILIDANHWWIASKTVVKNYDRWPGGVPTLTRPENMISRAYLKIAEAIAWSGLPMALNDPIVEIGSAPGGACQRLLEMGMRVTGVDPAEMHPWVAEHPNFQHWRARSLQVKRKLFREFKYLVCDANVAPNYTLDTVESIATHPTSQLQGLLLTVKLSDWAQATELPNHLDRVRSWGFERVDARQLAHNRREYCLVAEKRK